MPSGHLKENILGGKETSKSQGTGMFGVWWGSRVAQNDGAE